MERWIILPDLQVPYHDKVTLRAVERYIADNRWDGYLNLGDFLDFNELSSYVEGKPGAVEENVAATFAAGNEVLDRHCRAVRRHNPEARMVLLQGNHDYRAVSYGNKYPALKEHLDVPTFLRLRERDIEWVESWDKGRLFRLGNAYFLHGNYTSKFHAEKMVGAYGVCVYYGHTHDLQTHSKMGRGNGQTLEAGSLGCLCRYDQAYMQGRPHNWQQAIATINVLPDGYYNLYVTRIFKSRFVAPDGKVYDGRAA